MRKINEKNSGMNVAMDEYKLKKYESLMTPTSLFVSIHEYSWSACNYIKEITSKYTHKRRENLSGLLFMSFRKLIY